MFYYLLILFICLLLFYWTKDQRFANQNKDYVTNSFLCLLGLFLCFGYTTGTDWRTYERMYDWVALNPLSMFLYTEPAYVIYSYIFSALGIEFFHFFIFTKLILYIIMIRALKFYCPKAGFYISLLFFIAWYAFFLFIDNPMRNLIAICIFLSALKYLRERRFRPYLLMTLLAMSFHFSAVIMLFFYYLGNRSYSTTKIVMLYVILNVLLLNNSLIFGVLGKLFSAVPIVGDKIATYAGGDVDGQGKLLSLGLIVHTLIFILLVLGRKKIEEYPHGKMIFTFATVFSIFFRLGLTITVMGRFQFYIIVFYVAAIGMLYYAFEIRSRVWYMLFILVISVGPCISYLTRDSRYIPYTNYLFFIGDNMSFEERSEYNPVNSFYKAIE